MLLILVDNAISLMEDASGVAIAVADTGAGIPADQLPFIFDRFWRADKARSRDAGGSGLGLAIARDIAQSHGAQLTVESSVGRGSTFTVWLTRSAGDLSTLRTSSEQRL
jgi:two-component system sensor histidine kinase BaeS